MARREISDEVWRFLEPMFPAVKPTGRPRTKHRSAVEGVVSTYPTGAPWRDVPGRFGKWNSIYKRFSRWTEDGTWDKPLGEVHKLADTTADLDSLSDLTRSLTAAKGQGDQSTSATGNESAIALATSWSAASTSSSSGGIAMRTDKLTRNYRAAIALAATLI